MTTVHSKLARSLLAPWIYSVAQTKAECCWGNTAHMLSSSVLWHPHTSRPWSQTRAPRPVEGPGGGSVSPPTLRYRPRKARAPLIQNRKYPCRNDLVLRQANSPTAGFLCWLSSFSKVNVLLIFTITLLPELGGGKGKEEVAGRERKIRMREKCWYPFLWLTKGWLLFQSISQWDNRGGWMITLQQINALHYFFLK